MSALRRKRDIFRHFLLRAMRVIDAAIIFEH
jgi:hypothetical protein